MEYHSFVRKCICNTTHPCSFRYNYNGGIVSTCTVASLIKGELTSPVVCDTTSTTRSFIKNTSYRLSLADLDVVLWENGLTFVACHCNENKLTVPAAPAWYWAENKSGYTWIESKWIKYNRLQCELSTNLFKYNIIFYNGWITYNF